MKFECARCHTRFPVEAADGAKRCPRCKAEAGLEAGHAAPLAMKLFGGLLGGSLLLSALVALLALGKI